MCSGQLLQGRVSGGTVVARRGDSDGLGRGYGLSLSGAGHAECNADGKIGRRARCFCLTSAFQRSEADSAGCTAIVRVRAWTDDVKIAFQVSRQFRLRTIGFALLSE